MDGLVNEDRIYIIRVVLALIVLVTGIFIAFSDKDYDTAYNKIHQYSEIEPIELCQGDILEQSVVFDMDRMNSLGIWVVNRTQNCTGEINVSITDNSNEVVWQAGVMADKLRLQSTTWFAIRQQIKSNERYVLRISAESMKGSLLIASIDKDKNSNGIEDNASKNEIKLEQTVAVQTTFYDKLGIRARILIILWAIIIAILILAYERFFASKMASVVTLFVLFIAFSISAYFRLGFKFSEKINYIMFAGLVFSFVMVLILYLILLVRKCEKVECYFVVSSLVFGIVFSIILPPYSTPDEGFHYTEAYRLSNAMMGQPVNDEYGHVYMRECDIRGIEHHPNNEYTINMIKHLIRGDKELSEKMMPSDMTRNGRVSVIMYLPQATGITIGRITHANYERTIFAGRWMNLLFFTVIVYMSIKLVPYGKWIFYAICQIPIVMELTSSYSYDTMILSFAFLFVAYLLRLCEQSEKASRKQLLWMALIAVVYASTKPVYLPLTALVFLIPNSSISESGRKNVIYKSVIFSVSLASLLLVQKCSFMSMEHVQNEITAKAHADSLGMVLTEDTEYEITDTKPANPLSIQFIMENPFALVEGYMGAFIDFTDNYLLQLFGNQLGWLCIWIPYYISVFLMVLVYMAYQSEQCDVISNIRTKGRCWAAFLVVGSSFAVLLSMYYASTNPSERTIQGVQGRYFLPLLITLPVFLRRKGLQDECRKVIIVMFSLTIQILSLLSIGMQIWNQ